MCILWYNSTIKRVDVASLNFFDRNIKPFKWWYGKDGNMQDAYSNKIGSFMYIKLVYINLTHFVIKPNGITVNYYFYMYRAFPMGKPDTHIIVMYLVWYVSYKYISHRHVEACLQSIEISKHYYYFMLITKYLCSFK